MSVVLGAHTYVYLYITAYIKGIQNKNLKLITFALQQIWFMALCRLFPLTLYSQSSASAEVSRLHNYSSQEFRTYHPPFQCVWAEGSTQNTVTLQCEARASSVPSVSPPGEWHPVAKFFLVLSL